VRRLGALLAAVAALALGACGPEQADAPDEQRSPEPDGLLVAALGDSITAGSPGYDPDPAARARLGFGEDERSSYEFWAERAYPRLEYRNCGVFGERTDEIVDRLDACAEGADVLIVQGGINDIAQGRPLSDAAADLRAMVKRGQDLGLAVAIAEVLPWNNGHPAADRPIAALNREIAAIARDTDALLLRFHEALELPRGSGLIGAGLTSDGDHPSVAGYRLLGELVSERLRKHVVDPSAAYG